MLALLAGLDFMTNPWIYIPSLIFAIPILQTLLNPLTVRIKSGERERLRQMYERLALEKLDVIRTAITMGYKRDDLSELDERLEEVIGSEAMRKLLDSKSPSAGKAKPTVIGINIETGGNSKPKSKDKAVDLEELVQSELADGLRRRGAEQERE
jgi:hypothetical protein